MTIKELRNLTGLSQRRFSEMYNIPSRTIENWEMGINKCPEYVIGLLTRAVVEDLVKIKEENTMNIKAYNSNWEIVKGEEIVSIHTDADNINSDIYDNVEEVAEDIIEMVEAHFELTDDEKDEILTMAGIYFSARFPQKWYALQESDEDDWGIGTFDKQEALDKLNASDVFTQIAVIENDCCIYIIYK